MNNIWQQDYPIHNFDIVSPELPSGSAWLVNCLLELNVPIWNPWEVHIDNEWQRVSKHIYRYNDPKQSWQQTLPALNYQRIFNFDRNVIGRVTHRWASTIPRSGKLILFVRDPRDLLYSQWRRNKYNLSDFKLSFLEFIQSASHNYPINYLEYVLLYLLMWQNEINHLNGLIVRFEDYKNNPKQTLTKVLAYLNINRTDQQIIQSIARSDFKVLKKIEDNLAADGQLDRKFNFVSRPLEYNSYMKDSLLTKFYKEFNQLSHWLNYAPFYGAEKALKHVSDEWFNDMVDCILCGDKNHPNQHELYDSLKNVMGSVNKMCINL